MLEGRGHVSDCTNDQPPSGEAVPQATPSRWRPLPKPTCRKERAGLAREGLRGGGRGVLPPPRVHWLQSCRVGPTQPAIGCGTDSLHTGRGNWARLGPALGVRVATAAAEVDSRAGDGPTPGSQVKQEGYKVSGCGSIFEAAHLRGLWELGGTRDEWLCCPSWRGRGRGRRGRPPPLARQPEQSFQAQDSHCPQHTVLLRTHCACDSG